MLGYTGEKNRIKNAYATGNVVGVSKVGGIVGYVTGSSPYYTSYVSNAFALNPSVSGTDNVGKAIGAQQLTAGSYSNVFTHEKIKWKLKSII